MASINSWHVIGWPVSSRTLAAASRALSLLRLVFSLGGAADSVSGAVEGAASATAVAAALLRALVWNVGPPSRLGRHGPGGWEQMPPWSRFCSYASSWCVSAIVIRSGQGTLPCRHVTVSYLVRRHQSSYLSLFFPGFCRFFLFLVPIRKREPVLIVRGEPPKGTVFFVFFFCAFPKRFPSLSTSFTSVAAVQVGG